MENKREFTRYIIEAKVSFQTISNIPKSMEGQVRDISSLGWCAFFKESIDINTIIQFVLTAKFLEYPLEGSGRIVYSRQQISADGDGFRVGVEFIQADKDIISTFISVQQRIFQQELRKKQEEERKKQQSNTLDFGLF